MPPSRRTTGSRKSSARKKSKGDNKRNCVSNTNIRHELLNIEEDAWARILLSESVIKDSAGDTRHGDSTLISEDDMTDSFYWGDDELEPTHSDFDMNSSRPLRERHAYYKIGITEHRCCHCGRTPVGRHGRSCNQCRRNKPKTLNSIQRREVRRKAYKSPRHVQHAQVGSAMHSEKGKKKRFHSVKSKLKKLIRPKKISPCPPLSKFSNRKTGPFSVDSTDSEWGQNVVADKAEAFRKRRDGDFYKRHRYRSDRSSHSEKVHEK